MKGFLTAFSSILDFALNILELVAIIVSIATFFILMLNKYSKALKKILGGYGLGLLPRLRVLFICRKSQIKKRAFIEFAILKTGGNAVITAEWHAIINAFKSFYAVADQRALRYEIPNCTPLIEREFSEAVAKYFAYFKQKKVRRTFGIQEENFPWVIQIRIEEAYTTPTCLLTGLLSQYDESWEEFIKRYVSTAYIGESVDNQAKSVLPNELYFTFAWLLWGPSYELDYTKHWAGLCQLSYGDESNSVPAIADVTTNVAARLRNRFLENDDHRYGALISADLSLYEKQGFYRDLRTVINPANAYFYQKIEKNFFSFALRIDEFVPYSNYKEKKYYSTAYVWALFELADGDYAFKPEKSVAFFEHANLADKETYRFLVQTLIDKSLKHFEEIYKEPKNKARKYRFVCAMNDVIANACIKTYQEIADTDTEMGRIIRENISFETNYLPAEVFSAYDEFFAPTQTLSYEEVRVQDGGSLSDLARFYTEIYMEAFPDDNERETFDNLLRYLRKGEKAQEYRYHILLAKDETGKIIGGCVCNYFKKSNSAVIEFLAVRADLQSGGLGTHLYRHAISVLSADARACTKKALEYVCCEIDSPEYSKAEIKKYLYFWAKNNYWHLNFHYVQPALSESQTCVNGLWLTISSLRKGNDCISSALVADIVYDYLKFAMGIEDPESCPEYVAMKAELLKSDTVALSKIIE